MQNVPIIGKFLAVFGIFGLFAFGIAMYSARQMKSIDIAYSDLIALNNEGALALQGANRSLQTGRAAMADMMIAFTKEGNASAGMEVKASREAFIGYMDRAVGLMPSNARLPVLKSEGLAVFDRACTRAMASGSAASHVDEALASQRLFGQECQPVFSDVGKKFVAEVQTISTDNIAESNRLTATTSFIALSSVAGVICGFLVVLAIGFTAIRAWVAAPVRALATTMRTMAEGDLAVSIAGTTRRDEVGTMARAVQVFKDNGLAARALAEDAEIMRSNAETVRERTADADRIRARDMAQATSGLGDGLKHLASGDLTFRLVEPFASDFETLRCDFNGAVSQLAATLRAVAESAGSIDNGSREVSASADDLSRRTEQQAAALEETAAALDQITANVANSSKRAEEARQIAAQANASAARSGRVVSDAVNAMTRIEQSSNQISSIIGVIDEIAFQTNLLALNAGVEAARAGDAGKGFAVVAQEVRELAQRSAHAAREIKDLIRNSAVEVQSGVELVRDTGEALKTIEGYIVSVNQQMDSIAISAREQAVGLGEVNTAINQMDQVTQKNAAMVEETSAAGAGLAGESARLRELISQFRPGDMVRDRPAAIVAGSGHRSFTSPARHLAGQVARAFSGNAAFKERREEV